MTRRFSGTLLALSALLGLQAGEVRADAPPAEYAASLQDAKGRLLRTSTPGGARHLELESAYDPRVATYLDVHGPPEIVYPIDRWRVRLLYLREDRMVTFVRESEERVAEVKGGKPIPPRVVKRLDPAERVLVIGVRAAALPAPPPERLRGSCFGVSPDGLVLTADHTVGEATQVRVRWADGTQAAARVKRRIPERDVALLSVDRKDLAWLPLAHPEQVRMGDRVFTIGFPARRMLGDDPKFADGAISGETRGPDDELLLVTSVPTQAGNSGSPLVNEAGQVVGLLIGSASHGAFLKWTGQRPQNVNFAVPVRALSSLVSPAAAPGGEPEATPVDRRAAIERVRSAVCGVEAVHR
ncbi:MAG: trypsin-like peptidase domain-containing protein [Deltaproteobacteria bacterium]|nr:trypsin-like peptidase domain-containing protein [Deltaproteobacteria bacterium]MBW2414797.1 trypsin-like peptidase domain-containing protein [Deltaproteobacteria bacterium]